MVHSYVGYCSCGCEVWIEYLFDGKEWFHRFFDGNFSDIVRCPDCGSELREDLLESLGEK